MRRVSSPQLVGRDDDLLQATEVLDATVAGQARVLLVGGEAGIGKSRLLGEVHERARARGFTVLAGSCLNLGEGALPFGPIADAFRGLRRGARDHTPEIALGDAADLARLLPGMGAGADGRAQPAPGRVFEAVLELLEGLAEGAPLLLSVEDAHWADQSTRDLLAFLSGTLSEAPVVLVATFRTDELHRRHPLRGLLVELERHPHVVRIDLEPLGRDEVADQLAAIQGTRPDPDLLASVWERSEGNPLYAEELLIAEQRSDAVPVSLRDGVLSRLAALGEEHQGVLRVAAAVGRNVDDALLADLTELPGGEFERIIRDLVDGSMLVPDGDGYRFRHALLQEVVYDELLPGERTRLHVRIAERLAAAPGAADDPVAAAELAHHWLRARRLPEALTASVTAGVAAEAIGAPADALVHFERALEVWDAVDDAADRSPLTKVDLVDRTATVAMISGRFEQGIALSRAAIAAVDVEADPVRAGLLHQRLGRNLFVADLPGGVEELERGLALLPAEPVTADRAGALAGYGQLLMLVGRHAEARAACEEALLAARAVGARQVEGHARNTLATVRANVGGEGAEEGVEELRAALEIALEVNDLDDIGRAYVNLTHSLGELGRWDELLAVGHEALAVTRRLGLDRTHGVYVESNLSDGLVALGRWDDAVAAQRAVAARLPSGHWGYFSVTPLVADRGDFATVHDAVTQTGRLPDHDSAVLQGLTTFTATRVALAVWEGRTADARALVEELLVRLPVGFRGWQSGPVLWRAVWAEADRAGAARARHDDAEVDDARRAADRAIEVLRSVVDDADANAAHPTFGSDGYALLATVERLRLDGDDSPEAWLAAAERFDALRIVFPAVYARFRAAEALVRTGGDRARAADLARDAAASARALGAKPLLALLDTFTSRSRLVRAAAQGDADDDGFGLSAREHEVLALVAQGRTNREIGDALYISPKTASVHISNILGKLGVSGRIEAAAVAQRLGLGA